MTATLSLLLGACTIPGATSDEPSELILADSSIPSGYNPIAGYAPAGASKLYDGLLRHAPDGTSLEPALAETMPTSDATGTTWTVTLRDDVSFTDGTPFDATDVAATYRAILAPASASEIASSYNMITRIDEIDEHAVRFTLEHPFAAFPVKLLVGIVPSERLIPGQPAVESTLNTDPVGTGPYELDELRPDRAVLRANPAYWDGAPAVEQITLLSVPDDNARALRLAAGELDGAPLPPLLAQRSAERTGMDLVTAPSADWRGVSMPSSGPVTGDAAIRRALNLAVDRDAMITTLLGGHGRPAHTPLPAEAGGAHEPAAVFGHDPEAARALLDDAGWRPGDDAIREKNGQRATFTVMYNPADLVRRDLAQAFAADARRIGIEVQLEALSWDRITPRIEDDAILIGGGEEPYDPDTQLYATWHSRYLDPGVGSAFDNASRHADPRIDALLDQARRATDRSERDAAYRQAEQHYIEDPGYVFLVFLDHTYLARTDGWITSDPILEPHAHGALWGPWWSVESWAPR
ncbi:ABC transporter substrate-binding protein [Hoyosella sp. G463]|uniref:ABC transporter substrate-binding protein n=1 Tax=Lolliginicoccus lacisalsi TaxID=2742202 RepID=A0A927JA46_9ACTN|nr:ABC transporter substrate-binding protein [Lolliginicoccus lacisalsi]MBD8504917.1 ABC transporter substrate-binding protein [Lolliginicoccus lacisalsi]